MFTCVYRRTYDVTRSKRLSIGHSFNSSVSHLVQFISYWSNLTDCSNSTSWTHYNPLSVLTTMFPGQTGLAGFTEATDDGSGDENWSHKSRKVPVKSSPPTNQHPTFYRPDAFLSPNQQCQSTEGKFEDVQMQMIMKHWHHLLPTERCEQQEVDG